MTPLATRVAEDLRRVYAPNFEPFRSDVVPLLADLVEKVGNMIESYPSHYACTCSEGHGYDCPVRDMVDADDALRALADALGIDKEER